MKTIADLMSDFPKLTRNQAAVVEELLRRNGRIASYSELSETIEAVSGNRTTQQAVTCCVVKANKHIAGAMQIKNRYGVGYQIEVLP